MTERYSEIDEVVAYIHKHIDEPLLLSHLARYAGYSPYHFTRIFKEKVGLTPLYYVSSLRLHKAKDLLLHTNLNIRDIGLEIGQQSLGTFTTRFTERVGVTPADFRNQISLADRHLLSLQKLNHWHKPQQYPAKSGISVSGTIRAEIPFEGIILVGLFPKPIPEGMPIHGTILSALGDFSFSGVQPGIYYLMATAVTWGMNAKDFMLPQTTLRARLKKPVIVDGFAAVPHQQVTLYAPRLDDPPILISLPLLMKNFLSKQANLANDS